MFNEIWLSVEGLFKPLHAMSKIISIPELTFDLMSTLRINLDDAQYSDSSRYKRVIKQQMSNPQHQLMNIIFDFEDENTDFISMTLIYDGKITLLNIIPYQYITQYYSIDGPIPLFMIDYLRKTRSIMRNEIDFIVDRGSKICVLDMMGVVAIHATPLLFTKWMNDVFGTESAVTNKIIEVLKDIKFPAEFTSDHIATYSELLRHSSIEKLLDYSHIGTEDTIITEAFLTPIRKELSEEKTDIECEDNHEDNISEN